MIIDTLQSDIKVAGDIKEFKTSIDPKNLEFITTLLSSNLYSDPEQSFIREIVSNAWDSHVEAGTTDVPVIIRFRKEGGYRHVTIRDYGVGLSPERFQEVYCNIGSSTKRDSNEFIGGFGIGKYSSLACSNTVYITSYYEGTAYYYVMVKSGNLITTNLLMEKPTAEKNGVEVTIKNITNITPYENALNYIIFFPNIYIDGALNSDKINNAKLKKFTNFAAASTNISYKLLLGNVLYPCNKSLLSYDARVFLDKISMTGIVIKFDVGEINITPNRESIIYSSDTIKKITDRIAATEAELNSIIYNKLTKDYNDILEYYNIISRPIYYNPVDDTFSKDKYNYKVELKNLIPANITYKGVNLINNINILYTLFGITLPNTKGIVWDDKIYSKKIPYRSGNENTLSAEKVLILNANVRLLESVKLYLKNNYNGYSIMTDITYQEFKNWIKEEYETLYGDCSNKDIIIDGIYESLYNRAEKLNLNNDAKYLAFKTDLYAGKVKIPIKEVILYVWNSGEFKSKKYFKNFSEAIDYIKSLKKGIIFGNMDSPNIFFKIAQLKDYIFIQARKNIITELKKLNLKCAVDTDWLFKRDPLLSAVKATLFHFPNNTINKSLVAEICRNLNKNEANEFNRLIYLRNIYGDNYYYRGIVNTSGVDCDPYTEYLCLKLKNYIKKHIEVKNIIASSCLSIDSNLATIVIMKTKAYKISDDAYQRIKNNKLLRVLCKK